MVAQDRCRLVEQIRDLRLTLALEGFFQQVDVVAPASLDEDLANGGALSVLATGPSPSTVLEANQISRRTSCSSSLDMVV